jgi:hypothetical protein
MPVRDADRSIAPSDAAPDMTGEHAPAERTGRTSPRGGSPFRARRVEGADPIAPPEPTERPPAPAREGERSASGPALRSARGAPFAYGVITGEGGRGDEVPITPAPGGGATRRPAVGDDDGNGAIDGAAGDRARDTGGQPRLMQLVSNLHLGERLFALDDEARELRNARVRKVGFGVGAVALAGVLIYAVFPVRTVLDQWDAKDRGREQLDVLTRENERLERRAADLREAETIEEIARREHGYVMPGEESYAVLPPPRNDDAPPPGGES